MIIRNWKNTDYESFAKILYDTWISFRLTSSYEEGIDKAKRYLQQCINQSTIIHVIEVNNEAIGLLMVRSKSDLETTIGDKNYFVMKNSARYQEVCNTLLLEANQELQEEIILLVIKPTHKRNGYGNILFQKAVNYFQETGSRAFFLYSDSNCDYAFYKHCGMNQIAEKPLLIGSKESKFKVYLYKGDIASITSKYV